ncbi:MAG: hypothetical protein ACOY3P_24225 [Planctomycetota bacterium]
MLTCNRCGLTDDTVIDLDIGPTCHRELRHCIAALKAEIERLRGNLGKLYGTVKTYCNAPAQIRGEAFRDMAETLSWIDGADDLCGWPACYERLRAENERLLAYINSAARECERCQLLGHDQTKGGA